MSRTVYVNNVYLPEQEAEISIFDRGFLFADSVYEVTAVLNGRLVDYPAHMARLGRSLDELSMRPPASAEELLEVHHALVARNELTD